MSKPSSASLPNFISEREAFLAGTRQPSDLLEECIANIENHEPAVRAFTYLDIASARRAAKASDERYKVGSPLSSIDGLPISVKDIIDTGDMPTELNSLFYHGNQPRIDAACVAAAKSAGAVILGKTVTTEFALGRSGPTRNPHNLEHTPGGSSSGAAAGTASGMFAAGFATQTLGSILRPASYNGVVGFKPTYGALSLAGIHPLSGSHDHLGVIGQNIDTVWALACSVNENAPGPDCLNIQGNYKKPLNSVKPQRLAIARVKGFEQMDEAASTEFESLLDRLRGHGVSLVDSNDNSDLKELINQLNQIPEMSEQMVAYDMRWPYSLYRTAAPEKISLALHEWIDLGETITLDQYRALLNARAAQRQSVDKLREHFDGVLMPASAGPAPHGLEKTGSRIFQQYWSFLGFPAFSLPLMSVDQMPFGLQVAGFSGQDHGLAQVARWLESFDCR